MGKKIVGIIKRTPLNHGLLIVLVYLIGFISIYRNFVFHTQLKMKKIEKEGNSCDMFLRQKS